MPKGTFGYTVQIFAFKFRIFYTIHDSNLIMTTRPDLLKNVVNEAASAQICTPGNMIFSVYPGKWRSIMSDMLLSYEEKSRKNCLAFLTELEPFAALEISSPDKILGASFSCPDSGEYTSAKNGSPSCSIHGKTDHPKQRLAPTDKNGISQILNDLDEISISFQFIKEGIHSTVYIKRKVK